MAPSSITRRDLLVPALVMVLVFVVLNTLMLVATGGYLARAHWFVLVVSVGIVTGILFWTLTPGSTGEVNLPELGIRLCGGAAIGAAFMLLAWYLTSPAKNEAVIPLSATLPPDIEMVNLSTEAIATLGEVRTLGGRRMIYVQFSDEAEAGTILVRHLNTDLVEFVEREYRVTRDGRLELIEDEGGD